MPALDENATTMTNTLSTDRTPRATGPGARIRNIGIMAHIDAGKTTLTERMLYVTGRIHRVGEVHDGLATMDFLDQERERGITISSAATTVHWDDHAISIIDTPGHVDFTAEVERSLRVLDGAIGVFCAVAGVEAQSETVWRQADRYRIPRIAFINKMDRRGASYERALASMHDRLGAKTAPLHVPVGEGPEWRGSIDLLEKKWLTWRPREDGTAEVCTAPVPDDQQSLLEEWRERLVEAVADVNDPICEKYLMGEAISHDELRAALRQGTLRGELTPVLAGSALHGKGISSLLDAIRDYLPSPLDVPPMEGIDPDAPAVPVDDEDADEDEGDPDEEEEVELEPARTTRPPSPDAPFSAMAFKTVADPTGNLTYLRIYSGTVAKGERVLNPRTGNKERLGRIYAMHAERRESLEEATAGQIVAVTGPKTTRTGDTLADPDHPVRFGTMSFPEPVISISVTPSSSRDREKLARALAALSLEDPTFRTRTDEETDEIVISGMGELHLEVITDRLRRHHRVAIETGRPRVAYRQTLARTSDIEARHVKQTGGRGEFAVCRVRFEPDPDVEDLEFEDEIVGGVVPREFIPSVEKGIRSAMNEGRDLDFPFVGVRATLHDGKHHEVDSSERAFETAGKMAFRRAVDQGGIVILEPRMKLEVLTPDEFTGDIVGDLGGRRADIRSIDTLSDGSGTVIKASVPLATMFAYTTTLRSITSGRGTATLEFETRTPVPEAEKTEIIEEARRRRKAR